MSDNFDFDRLAQAKALRAPEDFNGSVGHVDLANPVERIGELFKLVVSRAKAESKGALRSKSINLRLTMARIIWVTAGMPADGEHDKINQQSFSVAVPNLGRLISMFELIRVASASKLSPKYRRSDVVRASVYRTMTKANSAMDRALTLADKYFGLYCSDPDIRASCLRESKMVILLPLANAIHRQKSDLHNLRTLDLQKPGTVAHRVMAIAGAAKDEFRAFCAEVGHDLFHWMTDETLYDLVDMLTGQVDYVVPAGVVYNGRKVGGAHFEFVIILPESAKDRWPIGTVGISGLILGLGCVEEMVMAINIKLRTEGAVEFQTVVVRFKHILGKRKIERSLLLDFKNILNNLISVAVGFKSLRAAGREQVENTPSLNSYADKCAPQRRLGRELASFVEDKKADPDTMRGLLESIIAGGTRDLRECLARMEATQHPVAPARAREEAASSESSSDGGSGSGGDSGGGDGVDPKRSAKDDQKPRGGKSASNASRNPRGTNRSSPSSKSRGKGTGGPKQKPSRSAMAQGNTKGRGKSGRAAAGVSFAPEGDLSRAPAPEVKVVEAKAPPPKAPSVSVPKLSSRALRAKKKADKAAASRARGAAIIAGMSEIFSTDPVPAIIVEDEFPVDEEAIMAANAIVNEELDEAEALQASMVLSDSQILDNVALAREQEAERLARANAAGQWSGDDEVGDAATTDTETHTPMSVDLLSDLRKDRPAAVQSEAMAVDIANAAAAEAAQTARFAALAAKQALAATESRRSGDRRINTALAQVIGDDSRNFESPALEHTDLIDALNDAIAVGVSGEDLGESSDAALSTPSAGEESEDEEESEAESEADVEYTSETGRTVY